MNKLFSSRRIRYTDCFLDSNSLSSKMGNSLLDVREIYYLGGKKMTREEAEQVVEKLYGDVSVSLKQNTACCKCLI